MNFRRSVMRILFTTAFLLLVAWVSLKLMVYRGDWDALLRDVQNTDVVRWFTQEAVPFFRNRVLPALEELASRIHALFGGHAG